MSTAYKILVLGADGVGKSALVLQFCQNIFDPSIGSSYCKQQEIDSETFVLQFLEFPGEEEFYPRDEYIRRSDAFIFAYSITCTRSLDELAEHILAVQSTKEADITNIASVIAGTKCDLVQERQVMEEEAQELAQVINAPFMETSAKTGTNVHDIFIECVRKLHTPLSIERKAKVPIKKCVLM